jgi:AcrR family transcriptional regulator
MDTHDALLAAALKVLEEDGEARFSTRNVCALANVTAPTFYYHYGSADKLVQERFGKSVKALNKLPASGLIEERIESRHVGPPEKSPRERGAIRGAHLQLQKRALLP